MRRRDIRRGTIYTAVFFVVAFIAIWVFRPSKSGKNENKKNPDRDLVWSDTLTNNSSDYELLYPMEKDIERFMSKWNIRGMSVAVMRNDSLLYAKGFGWRDEVKREPMEAGTIGRIASASKLVTAAAVMKLIEDGKLSFDTKVFGDSGILNNKDFTAAVKDKRVFDITVDNLLRHAGGFTRAAGDPMFNTAEIIKAKNLSKNPDNNELVKIVLDRRLGFTPGVGHRYSNFGYMLLSLVIERVTGQSYWDYVNKNILEPAGCYQFRPATNYLADRLENETHYYAPDDELVEEFTGSGRMVTRCYGGADFNALMGAGGWLTSAADLARFVASIDGLPGVKDILKRESVNLMSAREGDEKLCFGWTDSDGEGNRTRSGTLSSAHALIMTYSDGETWVMITNTGVWTGYKFTSSLRNLMNTLRPRYRSAFPDRNLF